MVVDDWPYNVDSFLITEIRPHHLSLKRAINMCCCCINISVVKFSLNLLLSSFFFVKYSITTVTDIWFKYILNVSRISIYSISIFKNDYISDVAVFVLILDFFWIEFSDYRWQIVVCRSILTNAVNSSRFRAQSQLYNQVFTGSPCIGNPYLRGRMSHMTAWSSSLLVYG